MKIEFDCLQFISAKLNEGNVQNMGNVSQIIK